MTDVAVVIGNYNGEALLGDCIGSLDSQTLKPSEVIVVDGASTDGSIRRARELGARVIKEHNRGLGFLYNRGTDAATADHVLLANNDVAFEPDCVERLSNALDGNALAFCADARQIDWNGTQTIHARTSLRRGRMLREYLPGLHLDPNVEAEKIVPTVCANGASMLVRREMMSALDGFDETFFMEWEDLDLCWRAWLRGWSTLYVPQAVVRHRVGAVTTALEQPRRSASSHHNVIRFALKCLPPAAAARVVAGELLRAPRHRRAIGVGLAHVLRELPEIVQLRREIAPSTAVWRELASHT